MPHDPHECDEAHPPWRPAHREATGSRRGPAGDGHRRLTGSARLRLRSAEVTSKFVPRELRQRRRPRRRPQRQPLARRRNPSNLPRRDALDAQRLDERRGVFGRDGGQQRARGYQPQRVQAQRVAEGAARRQYGNCRQLHLQPHAGGRGKLA